MQAVTYPLQLQASEPYQRVLSPDSGTEGEEQGRMVGGKYDCPRSRMPKLETLSCAVLLPTNILHDRRD
jgi:hypothetical protein